LATPATRKLARDLGLDLRHVRPTGPGGRVTKADLMSSSTGEPQQADLHALPGVEPERVPFVGLRRRIAERMQTAKNTAAHFTFVEECDVARLKDVRQRLIPQAQAQGVELTYLAFIVTATVAALKKHPMLNARLDVEANELVLPREQNIGIAVATDQGLVVPVIHRADRLSILEIAKEIQRLSSAARGNELTVPELQGSTFTITSLGKQGGLLATPVINLPNVGILGVHRIKERPVVRDSEIVIGHIMLLSLTVDHRIVDGHVGAAFAYELIGYLEDPALLFAELR
jgi:pyruvate dehydrogenase E2 component (dihydrolipoamide acetyltransferase)